MSILKEDDQHFDHYVNGGSILEFKAKYHYRHANRDTFGELSHYDRDYTTVERIVHVRINKGGYVTRDKYPTILPLLFNVDPKRNGDALDYYSDFEFVRAITINHEVTLA